MKNKDIKTSKFLSYVLRHQPESIGLKLDAEGWAHVSQLIEQARKFKRYLTRELIEQVVRTNDKQRFSLSADGERIRANQGHSLPVNLGLERKRPPVILYHGTAKRFLTSIMERGLVPGERQYVHLSSNKETATKVGQRHGKPIVITVEAQKMDHDGYVFLLSQNGIWLTEDVPARYLQIM